MKPVAPFTLVGVPIDSVGFSGPVPRGTERSPAAWRDAGLRASGWPDAGDLQVRIEADRRDPITGIVGSDDVLRVTEVIRSAIAARCATGDRPLILGGCCTLAPAALAGARDALGPVGMVYVDGHLDLYDGVSSPTGEAADMPVAVVLGNGPAAWAERLGPGPTTTPANVALLGFRDDDELETLGDRLQQLRASGLMAVSGPEIHAGSPSGIGAAAIGHATASAGRAWLHIDLDVLDETVFPATDYLLSGGLDWHQLTDLIAPIVGDERLVGWSVACYNPDKDIDGVGARRSVEMIRAAVRA